MKKRSLLWLCSALVINVICPVQAEKPVAGVAEAMEGFVKEGQLAGAVTLVAQKGKVVSFEALGYQNLETKKPMQKDCLFWIASMTKPITAMGIMVLQDEGKLSVNDPVEKYLPEFKGQMLLKEKTADQTVLVKPSRQITIKDLLMHTSGLVSNSPLDKDAIDVLTLKEAVLTYALSPLQFEPGSKWQYCNPGINTLGRIIEVVSGEEYAAFLNERFFKPLGMRDTTFWPNQEQLQRLATSYKATADEKGLEPATIKYLTPPFSNVKRSPLAAGGLFSTAEDLLKLYQMMVNGGETDGKRYLSQAALKEMTTIHSGDLKCSFTEGMGMGLGVHVVREPTGVTATLSPGTFGHGGAYGTQGWIDPQKQVIHLLLIQRAGLKNSDASPMRQAFHEASAKLLQ